MTAGQWIIAFSDYYNDNFSPLDDFGQLFFDEWDFEQWNLFWNLLATCVQLYLKHGYVASPGERIEIRKLRQEMTEEFLSWAEEYFSDPEQRTGYVREDYIGLGASGSFNPLELISRSSVRQALSGWVGKDDMPMETPDLPEFITDYDAEIISQNFRLPESTDRHRGMIEYGYSRFVDYKIKF